MREVKFKDVFVFCFSALLLSGEKVLLKEKFYLFVASVVIAVAPWSPNLLNMRMINIASTKNIKIMYKVLMS